MKYVLSVAATAAVLMILFRPAQVSAAVAASVSSCLEVMIPSLFAFTVVAVYLQSSGLYRIMLKPLTVPLSVLMRLDEELCAVFVLGNIGGYPVGARLLSELVQQGRLSRYDAGRMLCFCYGSGPAFVISIVGLGVFDSAVAGGIIFAACFVTSLIIGIVICRSGKPIQLKQGAIHFDFSGGCFVSSVLSAARVMFTVCAMIVGFSLVTAASEITGLSALVTMLLEKLGVGASSAHILPALLEISCVQHFFSDSALVAPLCGALLSLGGACVLLQVSAVVGDNIPMRSFLLSRLVAMPLGAAFSCAAIPWCNRGAEYIQTSGSIQGQFFSVNAGMSICVLIMCGILISSSRKTQK